jgi:hypothetical protein
MLCVAVAAMCQVPYLFLASAAAAAAAVSRILLPSLQALP